MFADFCMNLFIQKVYAHIKNMLQITDNIIQNIKYDPLNDANNNT